jgi:hypothetical protein
MQPETETKPDLELRDLEAFYATQNYYKYMGVLLTDGIKYIAENGYSWFVTDAVAVIVAHPKIRRYLARDNFLTIRLKLNKKENSAQMVFEDGNYKKLYVQKYKITDAKRELTLFFCDNVLMLASEY